ncbi:baseplate J/gp47 family protein [Sphingomonas sp. PL-96]|uniref:baseplate assembly protein n=1 Tax=Sphingomonas sp. PL-96 TaxID=2887201 RepID=UPI001E64E9F0|nr:baseplate J/gp47 family protein [Sphingomonas sp. PL-96]MCC2976243.1 baseplate J/gp47 family protein [Sphingomonas sp. PL-96]
MPASTASTLDLSSLPAPDLIERLPFDTIVGQMVADVQLRLPSFDATVDSDPAVIVLQVAAYHVQLLRAAVNDAARQVMVASATGANLDQLAALVGVARLTIDAGDPAQGIVPTLESDAALRQRIVLAPESFSVAGPELAYVYHATSADGAVRDASATSPAPGQVLVSVLARDGDGTAPAVLLAKVAAVVGSDHVRPLGDLVTVASAEIRRFEVVARLVTFSGPDVGVVLTAARVALDEYLAASRRLGRDITRSGLYAALHVSGVMRVEILAPAADVVCDATQAAYCTDVTLTHGGYDD